MQFSLENTYARVSLLIKLQAGDTSLDSLNNENL